jgi:hypothetical protein
VPHLGVTGTKTLPRATTAWPRAARATELGQTQPDADNAVSAGLRARRDLGTRAPAARGRQPGARGTLAVSEREIPALGPRRHGVQRRPRPRSAPGRTEEVYGEDLFLTGTPAPAFARGLAGGDPRHLKATSLLKHFLANSKEDGRFHTSSNFDERLWREYYAKSFEMAVRDGIEAKGRSGVPRVPDKFGVKWVADLSDVAVEAARKCDVVVVCVGNHPEGNASWEILTEPSDGKEGVDRRSLDLPPTQLAFIRKVMKANPRTVVALVANFPYVMPWVVKNVPALVQLTHASQEQGHALADVLFGDFDPGGKLVQTWPKSLADLPPMMDYDIRNGRTDMYAKQEPQFAFGYGLSYTTFALSNLRAADTLARDGTLEVSVDAANTGARAGDEVVQLYVRFPQSKVERAPKALKGFQRLTVEPGKTATATIKVRAADPAYWDVAAHAWVVEPGPVELLVGNSSRDADLALRKTVTVQ